LQCRKHSEDLLNYNSPVSGHELTPAKKLQWKIMPESAKDIEIAKMNIDRYGDAYLPNLIKFLSIPFISAVSDCVLQVFIFKDYGKGFVKSYKLSPDSFIQIALQLTFYKYV